MFYLSFFFLLTMLFNIFTTSIFFSIVLIEYFQVSTCRTQIDPIFEIQAYYPEARSLIRRCVTTRFHIYIYIAELVAECRHIFNDEIKTYRCTVNVAQSRRSFSKVRRTVSYINYPSARYKLPIILPIIVSWLRECSLTWNEISVAFQYTRILLFTVSLHRCSRQETFSVTAWGIDLSISLLDFYVS